MAVARGEAHMDNADMERFMLNNECFGYGDRPFRDRSRDRDDRGRDGRGKGRDGRGKGGDGGNHQQPQRPPAPQAPVPMSDQGTYYQGNPNNVPLMLP